MMSKSFISFWGCIICSTVWASSDQCFFAAAWFIPAVIYGIISVLEVKK